MQPALLTSRAIIGAIYNALTMGDGSYVDRYAMRVSSKQETETYGWFGQVPVMREWIGGRDPKRLRDFTWTITNKDYEATLEVLVKEMRRDATGQLMPRIAELARRVNSFPAKLMTQKIIDGESVACYDSQYFFDTDHSEGSSGTQDNDRTSAAATGTTPTVQEMRDAILSAIEAIIGFVDDQGEPMNEDAKVFEVMTPMNSSHYWQIAKQALGATTFGGGETNILANLDGYTIRLVPNARLTWTTKFAVFRTDAQTKPFILQEEVPLNVSAVAEGSQLEFTDRKHWYGVDWAGNLDFGFWQHACLHTFT
jgi:phage major head subunit gpT-like protein